MGNEEIELNKKIIDDNEGCFKDWKETIKKKRIQGRGFFIICSSLRR